MKFFLNYIRVVLCCRCKKKIVFTFLLLFCDIRHSETTGQIKIKFDKVMTNITDQNIGQFPAIKLKTSFGIDYKMLYSKTVQAIPFFFCLYV